MRQDLISRLAEISEEEQRILSGAPLDMTDYNRTGDAVMESSRLLRGSRLFGIRTHTRFVDFPLHSHSYVEMIWQVQGSTVHLLGGDSLLLPAGNLLLLGRGTEHAIHACGRDDIAVNFILVPAFFDTAAISIGGSNALSVFLRSNLRREAPAPSHLLYEVSGVVPVENLLENLVLLELEEQEIQRLKQEQARQQRGSAGKQAPPDGSSSGNPPVAGVALQAQLLSQRQELQQKTLELLLLHLSGLSANLVVQERSQQEQAVVLSALSRIESDVKCTLSSLAEENHMSLSSLSRLIQRHTGCTFTELLHTARFNRAMALLSETSLSVADIVAAVGYENTAFFYRNFEKRFGCTPAEYRSLHKPVQSAQGNG